MPQPHLLAHALALAAAVFTGCGRDAFVGHTLQQTHALSRALIDAVGGSTHARTGVARAQTLLEERRNTLQAQIVELKGLSEGQMSAPVRARWRDSLIDDLSAVESLKAQLSVEIAADPELGDAVDTLIHDFGAILSQRPPPDS